MTVHDRKQVVEHAMKKVAIGATLLLCVILVASGRAAEFHGEEQKRVADALEAITPPLGMSTSHAKLIRYQCEVQAAQVYQRYRVGYVDNRMIGEYLGWAELYRKCLDAHDFVFPQKFR